MNNSALDMTVIIPVYNAELYVAECLDSLLAQDCNLDCIEVIAVNDGSTDRSLAILKEYEGLFSNMIILDEENSGAASSRNKGLKIARGKYILFLDADDTLSSVSISQLVAFFNEHYEEIDLLEYVIQPVRKGKKLPRHYRYRFLNKSGIYDLRKKPNWYACVTTMNFCIKNRFEDNLLFEDIMHEDQLYSMKLIKEKLVIGYCAEATYYYRQQVASVTKTRFYAYYLFDATIGFWESAFSWFDNVPEYYQALFISDLSWKFKSDILFPYHLQGEEYQAQVNRIRRLLKSVSPEVILNHPAVNRYHRSYFLELRGETRNVQYVAPNSIALFSGNNLVFSGSYIDVNVRKMRIQDNTLYMKAVAMSPAFYRQGMPKAYMVFDNAYGNPEYIELRDSSFSYYASKTRCAQAYLLEMAIDLNAISKMMLYFEIAGKKIEGYFVFPNGNIFSDRLQRYEYYGKDFALFYKKDDKSFRIYRGNAFKRRRKEGKIASAAHYYLKNKKKLLIRAMTTCFKPKREIWLYYDCKGVKKDNGYYQFAHDSKINDGVKRYYVSNNEKEFNKKVFGRNQRGFIRFSSLKHKLLYLRASKVITAYIEHNNCCPFSAKTYSDYLDIATIPEVVYLQHGVLHAHMPWKYSYDRLFFDREVVSTKYELNNLTSNYCFEKSHIIQAGMPRYDYIDQNASSKRMILYAPSWRSYLVGAAHTDYAAIDEVFLDSEFYKETSSLLGSRELQSALDDGDYVLNFQLHPIMKKYEKYYLPFASGRIRIGETNPASDYRIFITDFSSLVYDYAYLKRAIIYFVPDYVKFKAGMNLYREVDLKFEDGLGEFCQTSIEASAALVDLIANNGKPKGKYLSKLDGFFLHYDSNQCERIYRALIAEKMEG